MVRSRTVTALAGLAVGGTVSVAAWVFFETALFLLFLPFVPIIFGWGRSEDDDEQRRISTVRDCPECSFQTTEPAYDYCPRDGRRLRERRE